MKRLMLNNNSEFNAWKSNIDKQYPSGLDHFNPRVPKAYPVLVLYYMHEISIDAHFAPIKKCEFDYVYPAEFDTSITSVQEHPELIIEGRLCNVRIPERLETESTTNAGSEGSTSWTQKISEFFKQLFNKK